jgi:hypothetical protein
VRRFLPVLVATALVAVALLADTAAGPSQNLHLLWARICSPTR